MLDPQCTAAEIAEMRVNPVVVPLTASTQAVFKEPPTTPPMIGPFGHPQPKAPPPALPEDPHDLPVNAMCSPQPKAPPPAGPSQERQAADDVDAFTAREVSKGLALLHDGDNAAREHLPELAYEKNVQALQGLLSLDKSHPRVVALRKTIAEYVEVAEGLADAAGRASAAAASAKNVAMVGWLEESANKKPRQFMVGD